MDKLTINDKIPVNDGGGLWDNAGLCDVLVNDCNNAVKQIASGQYISFCSIVVQMVQKLTNLKKAIKDEIASKNKIIEELKQINNTLVEKQTGVPVAKYGDENDN